MGIEKKTRKCRRYSTGEMEKRWFHKEVRLLKKICENHEIKLYTNEDLTDGSTLPSKQENLICILSECPYVIGNSCDKCDLSTESYFIEDIGSNFDTVYAELYKL